LNKDYQVDLPIVNADPKLLRIVLQNLLSNAVKYTQEKGKIDLEIKKQDKDILIKIQDNGLGIPKRQQGKIFSKLFRADNVLGKDTDGTGLGLYIVKEVIEQSGGKIWFNSEENKGTSFFVTIPLSGMKEKKGTKVLAG
jgi:signal transduction histidine kinase